ncbi:hypothetical protein AB0M35_15135 [Micromonospora sp. NPDC051196]|uniref:hypothetical protein n=1 Tax=Micromonospora sp. NPDC051196 TaxID=3155281 RepID=UPI00341C5C87
MSADDVPEVSREKLGPLRQVGDGGQGIVYFTDRVKINRVWDAAYKEYLPTTSFDPCALRRMVAFVPELDADSGRWLCENTAWPAALVVNSHQVSGFLMRRIPDRFWMPWGDNGAEVPAGLQFLLNPQAYLNRKGIRLNAYTRLQLLEAIADVIARLHSFQVVIGDLSPNNLLIDIEQPGCFLIDCDAMRLRGQDVLNQVETPEWSLPHKHEPTATMASDSYKFGLLATRLFSQDQMGQNISVLAGVSSELGVLARRSLQFNSTQRPSMGDWLSTLRAVQSRPVTHSAPSVRRVVNGSPHVLRKATVPTAPPTYVKSTVPQPRSVAPGQAPRHKAAENPVMEWLAGLVLLLLTLGCVALLVELF